MFDKLLLIAEGYPVYYGKAREAIEYFSSLSFIPEIAMNPAEFLLDLATGQVKDISIPEELSAPQGSMCTEKTVVKVRICRNLDLLAHFSSLLKELMNVLFIKYISISNLSLRPS